MDLCLSAPSYISPSLFGLSALLSTSPIGALCPLLRPRRPRSMRLARGPLHTMRSHSRRRVVIVDSFEKVFPFPSASTRFDSSPLRPSIRCSCRPAAAVQHSTRESGCSASLAASGGGHSGPLSRSSCPLVGLCNVHWLRAGFANDINRLEFSTSEHSSITRASKRLRRVHLDSGTLEQIYDDNSVASTLE